MGGMRNLVEGELCPSVTPAPALDQHSGSNMGDDRPGSNGSTGFWSASASLAISIFMADLVAQVRTAIAAMTRGLANILRSVRPSQMRMLVFACLVQVEGHCTERGWALARLWNAHIAISAQTARTPWSSTSRLTLPKRFKSYIKSRCTCADSDQRRHRLTV